jgi:hypothetical protein
MNIYVNLWWYLVEFFFRIKKSFRQNLRRKSKYKFYVQNLLFKSRVVYEIMWKNMVEPDRPQMTI